MRAPRWRAMCIFCHEDRVAGERCTLLVCQWVRRLNDQGHLIIQATNEKPGQGGVRDERQVGLPDQRRLDDQQRKAA
jgi:hypothetical protein